MSLPELTTERLVLRSFRAGDAPAIERLAGAYEVALNTLSIPHPYPPGAAAQWIAMHETDDARSHVNFAITVRDGGEVAGSVGLVLAPEHDRAEVGYWVGVPYWNRGYATEAVKAIIEYGFGTLGLHRIYAGHFARNPGSGRVMQKAGMTHEGRQREAVKKWDEYLDIELYAILRSEWEGGAGTG